MPQSFRLSAGALLGLLLCACGERARSDAAVSTDSTRARDLTVTRSAAGILLTNPDTVPIYFTVFDAALLPRIEWAPCTEPQRCDLVAPGARRTVMTTQIRSDTAAVFWWRLIPAPDGRLQTDSVRFVSLPIR